ncbi:hypothetical protein NLG97_g10740 [Lecanicillium saksenae]|uniref:Uncharacterized protein n=1 Tax=Lecanicillium saksenae TaxID=468837 RepID=A0ACC1QDN9_9HYPO|nr:hypothetical protein NLG97_g10740 [Lecanicillium saksenae]
MTSTQEEMTDGFRNLFKSERLVYTALEETDKCKELWWKARHLNVVNRALIDAGQPYPPSRIESDKDLARSVDEKKAELAVMVCLPATAADQEPTPIGYIIINRTFPRSGAYHVSFLEEHQNKGYGREAINWSLDYAFQWANMHRLAIGCLSYNERAMHLYESMGFVKESHMRSCFYKNGRYHDLIEFAMLRTEWEKLRGIVGSV